MVRQKTQETVAEGNAVISPIAVRLLNLGPTAWPRTQSVWRSTAELLPPDSRGAVIFGQPLQPYLTHGAQTSAGEVFDLAACARLELPVVRQPFSGGVEYHEVNHLLFQWVLPANSDEQRVVAGTLAALSELGVPAEYGEGRFTARGARIGMLAGGVYQSSLVYLGCLYLTYDSTMLARTLREPIAHNVTTVWAEAPRPRAPDAVQDALIENFARAMGRPIERDKPRVEETRRAKEIEMEWVKTTVEETDFRPLTPPPERSR
jgi:lipoate-protein ligase A